MPTRIAAVTALTLVLGFVVASLTGVRALGGVVLVLGGAVCAWWMVRTVGPMRTVATLVAVVVLFVLAHPLGHVIGSWPAVLLVAVAAGAVAYAAASPKVKNTALADPG
jgi:ABC-type siderophore export system fused ATPase/permease subunit